MAQHPNSRKNIEGKAWQKGKSGNPKGGSKLATARAKMRRMLAKEGPKALKVIKDIAHDQSVDKSVRLTASRDLVDRTIGKPTAEVKFNGQIHSVNYDVDMTEEDKVAAYQDLLKAGAQDPEAFTPSDSPESSEGD